MREKARCNLHRDGKNRLATVPQIEQPAAHDAVGIDREIGKTHLPCAFQKARRRRSVVVWIWEFHDHHDPRIGKYRRTEIAVGLRLTRCVTIGIGWNREIPVEVDRQHTRLRNEHGLDQPAQRFVTQGMPMTTNVLLVDHYESDRRFRYFLFRCCSQVAVVKGEFRDFEPIEPARRADAHEDRKCDYAGQPETRFRQPHQNSH